MFLLEITEKEEYRLLSVGQNEYCEKSCKCKTPKCWIDFCFNLNAVSLQKLREVLKGQNKQTKQQGTEMRVVEKKTRKQGSNSKTNVLEIYWDRRFLSMGN